MFLWPKNLQLNFGEKNISENKKLLRFQSRPLIQTWRFVIFSGGKIFSPNEIYKSWS